MKWWLSLLIGALTLQSAAQRSEFNTYDQCWATEGDASSPMYNTTGGHPSGFIQAADLGTGGTWYFSAPYAYLGNKLSSFQRHLRFDWQTDHPGPSYDGKDVILEGAGISIYYKVPGAIATSWTTVSVLLDTMGWRDMSSGAAVSRPIFKTVISGLNKILIRGEFSNKLDVGGLDNVILEPYDSIGSSPGALCQDSCFSFSDFSGWNSYTYQWFFPGGVPSTSNLQNPSPVCYPSPGNYAVTLILVNGCAADTVSKNITIQTQNIRFDTAQICYGSSYQLPGGRIVIASGNYTDTLKSVAGCDSTIITTTVRVLPATQDSIRIQNASCYDKADGVATFLPIGAAPFIYEVNGAPISGNSIQNLLGGNYSYTITDSFGCKISGMFTVKRPSPVVVVISPNDTTVESGAAVGLHATASDSVSYFWSPSGMFLCDTCSATSLTVTDNTTVRVIATSHPNGATCTATAHAEIHVVPDIFLPTAFSPNNDGHNDVFRLSGKNLDALSAFQISIYNRWGAVVFQSTDPRFKWTAENEPAGVYVYYLSYYHRGDKTYSGNVTLLR